MKSMLCILLVVICLFAKAQPPANDTPLFPIVQSGLYGFIDSTGKYVIKPVYRAAGEFSEGLAPARINGSYGYINDEGRFVIAEQFDYARSFSDGLAVVYKGAKPYYINKKGEKAFDCPYTQVEDMHNGRARVHSLMGPFGLIDNKGELIMDTAFASIGDFVDGLAVVTDWNGGISKDRQVGVVDATGTFVIPYGTYRSIDKPEDGYMKVEMPAEPNDTSDPSELTGIVDYKGNLVLSRNHRNNSYIEGSLHDGLATMLLYKYWIPEEKGVISTSSKMYMGYIDRNGVIAINDTNIRDANDFSENRAFVGDNDYNYHMIDTKGRTVSKDIYRRVQKMGFRNGIAFVEMDGLWGAVDTNGVFVIKPQFEDIDEEGLVDDHFFFQARNPDSKYKDDNLLWGLADKDGKILIPPVMQDYDREGFRNGLLECVVKGRLAYLTMNGKAVWHEKLDTAAHAEPVNIDYMNRGYFYAYEKLNKKQEKIYHRQDAVPANIPKKIKKHSDLPAGALSLIVNTGDKQTIARHYTGFGVTLANTTKKKIMFNAQDHRLYMRVQAVNSNGEWQDIEYLPNSWCGNSYHTMTLDPKYEWTFVTPAYEGGMKTKLRIALDYIDPNDTSAENGKRKEITVYSNAYEGSINPAQFWRHPGYQPGGIMDPYNDWGN